MKKYFIWILLVIGVIILCVWWLIPSNTSTSNGSPVVGDRDCSDFSTQRDAQAFFESNGGPTNDFHGLDRDKDGVVCETLP